MLDRFTVPAVERHWVAMDTEACCSASVVEHNDSSPPWPNRRSPKTNGQFPVESTGIFIVRRTLGGPIRMDAPSE